VDIWAPGGSITAAWIGSNSATNTISGTSMASPHVAGVVALYLVENGAQSASAVAAAINGNATTGVVGNPGTGSPNRLLYSIFGAAPPPPPGTTVFFDNFETALGWTTNPSGTDTATTGAWQRANPETTTSGGTLQQGTTPSGVNALVTGAAAGASVGANDVDGGVTSVQSPAIALPSGTLSLSFAFYMAHLYNSSSADFLRVSIVGPGGTTQVFQEVGAANTDNAAYATQTVNISAFAGQTVRILIQAADASTASLVEAAVDDVRITQQ
jgi:subtilisin family serine protease